MKNKITIQKLRASLLMTAAAVLIATPSFAVDLVAIEGQWTPVGGLPIPMWGFATDTGQACNSNLPWTVGPQLTDTDLVEGNLTIKLRNCLSEAVSIIIPGQPATFTPVTTVDGQGRTRVKAFTSEAATNGGTQSYTWTGVKPGTYLYQSGSHPAKQVQMGLYGALTIGISPNPGSYAGVSGDVTLLFSEIDPALHSPPTAATPLGYHPRHYLVNGEETPSNPLPAGDTNQPTVLRMLNAGLDFHVPALNSGHMSLVAEDGNVYPFVKEQYSATLAAGKTIDALWQPAAAGNHVIYDRRGNGMVATLAVTAGVGAPVANPDSYAVDEDASLVTIAANLTFPGVLDNDPGPGPLTAILVSAPSSGTLNPTLAGDGSFTYTPNADFNGMDSFTYKGNDGTLDSNVATVTITVNPINDAPVAVDDSFGVTTDSTANVLDVLANDTDADGNMLFITAVGTPDNNGTATTDGSTVTYSPAGGFSGDEIFTYDISDGNGGTATATVTVTVAAPVNNAPVAVEDSATVVRNSTAAFINLTDNDSDADGNLKNGLGNVAAGQINITTGLTTTRGGTVTIKTNGVNYTPKQNFRGTDTFNYIVSDLDGAPSNEVTVRVNVVRP